MSHAELKPESILVAATAALSQGSTSEARDLCRRGYAALPMIPEASVFVVTLCRLEARAAMLDGNPEAALDALAAALAVAEASSDDVAAAYCLNNAGGVLLACGQLDRAEDSYRAARVKARRGGERAIAASTTLNVGVIASIRGDLRRALSYCRRALADFRELGMTRDTLGALNNLGMLHADLKQWRDAERAYTEVLEICTQDGDSEMIARVHNNLAEVFVGRGDLPRARIACRAAMLACDQTEHGAPRGDLHRMSGVVARESGALDESDVHFAAAERIAHERHDLLLLAEVSREQGDLYRRLGRNRDTLAALNRSHQLFRQLRAQRDLADVDRRMGRLEGEFLEVARRWGESIEAKDRYTQGHCQRVADLSCLIAEHAGAEHGFDPQTMFWYRIGALLHDVGKLDVSAEVLNKPGKLSDAEWAMMRGHAEAGVALLGDIEFPWDIRPIVLSHHERWDGRGYPHGLAGEAIPLAARVLAVADVYDALTSVRSYKRAMTHEDAMRIVRQDVGTAFDPQVVAWFEAVAPAWRATLDEAGEASRGGEAPLTADVRGQRRTAGLDEATGLPGRRAFFDECARVLSARVEDGRPTVLLLITVVPPTDAGAVGDGALFAVAEAISRNTRGGDFVGRYAERELVVLLPDTNAEEGASTLGRLREVVAAALHGAADGALTATADLVMSVAPDGGATAGALLAAADASLRRARGGMLPTMGRALQAA